MSHTEGVGFRERVDALFDHPTTDLARIVSAWYEIAGLIHGQREPVEGALLDTRDVMLRDGLTGEAYRLSYYRSSGSNSNMIRLSILKNVESKDFIESIRCQLNFDSLATVYHFPAPGSQQREGEEATKYMAYRLEFLKSDLETGALEVVNQVK